MTDNRELLAATASENDAESNIRIAIWNAVRTVNGHSQDIAIAIVAAAMKEPLMLAALSTPPSPTERGEGVSREWRPCIKRNQPGHFDSGGHIIIWFENDDQMNAILALFAEGGECGPASTLPEPLRAGEGERAAIVAFLRGETQSAYTDPQYDIGFNLAAAIERGDHLPALFAEGGEYRPSMAEHIAEGRGDD